MDNALQALLSWQFVLFCLGIATITYVFRIVMEYLMSTYSSFAKESKLWNNLIMPLLPITIGGVGAYLARKYPYPDGMTTISARIVFGLVAGLLSGLIYRVVRSFLVGKITSYTSTVTNTSTTTATVSATEGDVGAARNDAAK